MISRDDVINYYSVILGRIPENEQVINACMLVDSLDTLRSSMFSSTEFLNNLKINPFDGVPAGSSIRCQIRNKLHFYIDVTDQYVSLPCLRDNYEPIETDFICNSLQSGDVFVDIGANIGWHTINAAFRVGPTGHVYAFEPRDLSRELLKRSVLDNNFSEFVDVFDCGIGLSDTSAVLRWASNGINPGGASIDPTVEDADHSSQSIRLIALDSMQFDSIKLIKIDIEGAEYLAMQGAKNTLIKHRPIIVSEIIKGQIFRVSRGTEFDYLNFMNGIGYQCFELNRGGIGAAVTPNDIFNSKNIVNVVFLHSDRS